MTPTFKPNQKAKAGALGLEQYLVFGNGCSVSKKALGDAFEAVVAAVYLDGGLHAANAFVERAFQAELADPVRVTAIENPKGELQEYFQALFNMEPTYKVVRSTGQDHAPEFEVAVLCRGAVELGRGVGKSKKEAEIEAALRLLRPYLHADITDERARFFRNAILEAKKEGDEPNKDEKTSGKRKRQKTTPPPATKVRECVV